MAIIRNGRPFRGVRAGRLLISRHIEHGVFGNSVVLLTEHDHRRGGFGLVLNKREFRGVVELDERRDDLRGFFVGRGGPVETREAVTMLYRAHLGPTPPHIAQITVPVVGDLPEGVRGCTFVDGGYGDMWRDADAAAGLLRENGAQTKDAIFVTGYAGWGRNQLDGEVRAGAWRLVDADADWIFPDIDDRADLWAQLTREAEEQAAPGAR
mgnify:FL=1